MGDALLWDINHFAQLPSDEEEHRKRIKTILDRCSMNLKRVSLAVRILLTAVYPADTAERRDTALRNFRILSRVLQGENPYNGTGGCDVYPIHDAETCRKIIETCVELMDDENTDQILHLIILVQLGKKQIIACDAFMDRLFNLVTSRPATIACNFLN